MFLDKTELKELTGGARPTTHIRWLKEKGYPHEVGLDGYPRVLTSYVEKRLGGSLPEKHSRNRPKFAAIGAG